MKKVAAVLALFSTIWMFSSCKSHKEEKEESNTYPVTQPLEMDTVINKEYVTQIQSIRNIEVRAQEKGFLQNIYVDEGQFVKAGQTLFRIMPQIYQAEFMKSKAEMEEAAIELQNAKTLASNNVVSKNEQAVAQARLDKAKAEMNLAQIHLSFTDIKAPFSGIINRLPEKLGSLIDEGDLLTSLSDNTNMYGYFNVSEPEYLNYQMHAQDRGSQQVSLVMANGELFPQKGDVKTIEGEFDNETGNIAFRATFPNPDKILRNGETGKVRMAFPLRHVLIIPQKATYEVQDQIYVFVVGKDGKAESRNVTISGELPDLYVVSKGLSAEDKILLDGLQKVKDGDKLKTEFTDPKKVMKSLRLNAQ